MRDDGREKVDRTRPGQLRLVDGGALRHGDRVLADGRPATVVCAAFDTHVFRGQVSVLFDSGERDLLPAGRVLREPRIAGPQAVPHRP